MATNITASAAAAAVANRRLIASSPRTSSTNRNGSAVMKYHGLVIGRPNTALLRTMWYVMPSVVKITTAAHTASLPASLRRMNASGSTDLTLRRIAATAPDPAAVSTMPQYHPYRPASVSCIGTKLHPPTQGLPGTKNVSITARQGTLTNEVASALTTEPCAASSSESWVVRIARYC